MLTKSFSRTLFEHRKVIFMAVLVAALLCLPVSAFATDDENFAWNKGLKVLIDMLSGRTALLVSMVGIFFAGGMLIFGGDLGGFGRTVMMVVLVGSMLGALSNVASKFITTEGCLLL